MANPKRQLIVSTPVSLMTPVVMKQQLEVESQKRKLLTEYINRHMKKGIDYGQIEIVSKRTGKTYVSKPTLFKPGAEKFCSLFRIRAEYSKDDETWEMLGRESKYICYICRLYNGEILVGEGRGVCTVAEKDGSANNAVKIAKKRAKLDAVLETGGLSEFFTQDLEDEIDPMPARKKTQNVFQEAERMITASKLIDNLLTIGDRIIASEKFTPDQKGKLQAKITARLDELEAEAKAK